MSEESKKEAEATEHEQEHESLQRPHDTTKQRLADEYVRLSLQFRCALIQHKLALEYFEFRSFYIVFLPVTIVATLITIIGFLVSGTTQNDVEPIFSGYSTQIWSLVVGILGAISTLLNAIGKRANYQSQSDMHRSAVKALEKLCLAVDNERDWFDRNVRNVDFFDDAFGIEHQSNVLEHLNSKLVADLKTHQASFTAMLDACCESPVPYQVVQAFTLLEQIVEQQVFGRDGHGDSSNLDPLTFYYHKLWEEYSKYWLWPMRIPRIKVAVKYKEWKEEREGNVSSTTMNEDPSPTQSTD